MLVERGQLLLIQRATEPGRGRWSLPGGRVEIGETLADAVERECLEETGLEVEVGGIVAVVERITDDHHFVIVDHWVQRVGGTLTAGDDAAACRLTRIDSLDDVDLVDGLRQFLDDHVLDAIDDLS